MTPEPQEQSILIGTRPDGTEDRYCGKCGEPYLLPMPYEKGIPQSRDLCLACIHTEQLRRAGE